MTPTMSIRLIKAEAIDFTAFFDFEHFKINR